jgi:phosphinothricin acetyltransferase
MPQMRAPICSTGMPSPSNTSLENHIRLARIGDLEAINRIYNHYVLHSTCTYQEQPETTEGRLKWFNAHDDAHPITVIEDKGAVVGWGSLSHFHARSAFRFTVENSVYLDHQYLGRGLGSLLLADLVARAVAAKHHVIVAAVDSAQEHSISLHRKFGFEISTQLKQVGFKFGRWLDVVYLQRML